MRILFFTDNFWPESNAPASRTHEHARYWVRAGHEVEVVTCTPNFPHGKVFDGYRNRIFQREMIDGISVVRVWSFMSANSGFAMRVLDYLSFMVMAALVAPFLRRPDVVVGTSPQFFTLPAAWFAAKVKRVPWVLELRDLWPESVKAVGALEDSTFIWLAEALETFLYRSADRIVTVTNAFRRILISRGVDAAKIAVVTNGVDLSRYTPRARDRSLAWELGLEGKWVAGYVGTHGMAHGLETLLDAAERAAAEPSLSELVFLFVGDGARRNELQSEAEKRKLGNVRFVGQVPKSEVERYWSLLDLSIVHLKPEVLFETVIPSKIFECMGMGIPMLHGVSGESREIVVETGAGLDFPSGDASALVERLIDLAGNPEQITALAQNARLAAAQFDREALAEKMLTVLRTCGRQSAPGG